MLTDLITLKNQWRPHRNASLPHLRRDALYGVPPLPYTPTPVGVVALLPRGWPAWLQGNRLLHLCALGCAVALARPCTLRRVKLQGSVNTGADDQVGSCPTDGYCNRVSGMFVVGAGVVG